MLAVFDHHRRRYGTRCLQVELREKAFAPRMTDSTHGRQCASNLLLDQPRPTQANRV